MGYFEKAKYCNNGWVNKANRNLRNTFRALLFGGLIKTDKRHVSKFACQPFKNGNKHSRALLQIKVESGQKFSFGRDLNNLLGIDGVLKEITNVKSLSYPSSYFILKKQPSR